MSGIELTAVQAAVLRALPIEHHQSGRTARQVAQDVWPNDEGWRAGRVLRALEDRRLATQGDSDSRWWRTTLGQSALIRYRGAAVSGPYQPVQTRTTYVLRDGSTCTVDAHSERSATISREVDGRRVWGQVFSHSYPDVHAKQVADVVADMQARPEAFNRRLLWGAGPRQTGAGGLDGREPP